MFCVFLANGALLPVNAVCSVSLETVDVFVAVLPGADAAVVGALACGDGDPAPIFAIFEDDNTSAGITSFAVLGALPSELVTADFAEAEPFVFFAADDDAADAVVLTAPRTAGGGGMALASAAAAAAAAKAKEDELLLEIPLWSGIVIRFELDSDAIYVSELPLSADDFAIIRLVADAAGGGF